MPTSDSPVARLHGDSAYQKLTSAVDARVTQRRWAGYQIFDLAGIGKTGSTTLRSLRRACPELVEAAGTVMARMDQRTRIRCLDHLVESLSYRVPCAIRWHKQTAAAPVLTYAVALLM
jgi:hypothetical protein